MSGELGWGDRISQRGLTAHLGVSATPVRETLRRLDQALRARDEQVAERLARSHALSAGADLLTVQEDGAPGPA